LLQKYLYWLIILVGLILPIMFDAIAYDNGMNYPFMWSLFLIPSIVIMVLYPMWKVVNGTAIFFTLLMLAIEFNKILIFVYPMEMFALFLGIVVDWAIHFTIGYFIIKNKKMLQTVEAMTIIDPITGLYNRRYFNLFIEKVIPLSKKTKFPLLLVKIDIDYFLKLKDTYGHDGGKHALKHIANIVKENIRESDVLIKMDKDEFAILFPETTLKEGTHISEIIRESVEKSRFIYKGKHIPLSISLGLTYHKLDTVDEFIERTDYALYLAKANGRNQLVVADENVRTNFAFDCIYV
jgi:diguanylate cyclase (GGDEF)-like protein